MVKGAALIRDVHRGQWLSQDELQSLQWQRCAAQLAHAYERSPFYRRKLGVAGIHPGDIRGWQDFARIPITEREELREAEDLVASEEAHRGAAPHPHLGLDRPPAVSYFDAEAWLIGKYLLKLRARIACGMRPWDRVAYFQEADSSPRFPRNLLRERTFSVHRPVAEIVDEVERFQPTAAYGFPSHLKLLSLAARRRLRLQRIFTSGELLNPATRRTLESEYGAPVFDVYGCTETKEIAWQCPERAGYHINADWLVLESFGDGAAASEADTLLVTSLYNSAMPLLRYAMGDCGVLRSGRCACGRGLPLMEPTRGRTVDYFESRETRWWRRIPSPVPSNRWPACGSTRSCR